MLSRRYYVWGEPPWYMRDEKFVIKRKDFVPAYIKLREEGAWKIKEKAERAIESLKKCRVCPRNCDVDRNIKKGVCRVGRYAIVSSAFPHFGEEDCLRGWNGSGTIFFSFCNLRCVFCQNFDISWRGEDSVEVSPQDLAKIMIRLQEMGCHNINFVTPEHVVPQILEALYYAIEMGLRLPIVYNTSAYDSEESIELMDGIVDIYMPDFKIWYPEVSWKYLGVKDYPEVARKIIKKMWEQVGDLKFDENGLALRGLLVRHLVMPNNIAGTYEIMQFLAKEVSIHTYVNIMDQYHPAGLVAMKPKNYPEISRRITQEEYDKAVEYAREAGLYRFDVRWLRYF
jgi:putative pyruvate formate lyase activating enzyme